MLKKLCGSLRDKSLRKKKNPKNNDKQNFN